MHDVATLTNVPNVVRRVMRDSMANAAAAHDLYDGSLKRPQLWAWGSNHYGQLGQTISLCQTHPMLSGGGAEAEKSACPRCLWAGAHSGHHRAGHYVCVWKRGQRSTGVGSGVLKTTRPYLMGARERRGVSVATGWNHSLALMDNGDILGWGDGSGGCLGISDLEDDDSNVHMDPVPIPCLGISRGIPVARIATGGRHSAFVSLAGALYLCGENGHGQLGLGHLDKVDTHAGHITGSPPSRGCRCGVLHFHNR